MFYKSSDHDEHQLKIDNEAMGLAISNGLMLLGPGFGEAVLSSASRRTLLGIAAERALF